MRWNFFNARHLAMYYVKWILNICVSGFRAVMGYAYLRTHGYFEIKALKGRLDQLAGAITADRFYR
jgi:hypothetical protein